MLDQSTKNLQKLKRNVLQLCGTETEIPQNKLVKAIISSGIVSTSQEATTWLPQKPGDVDTYIYSYHKILKDRRLKIEFIGYQYAIPIYSVTAFRN